MKNGILIVNKPYGYTSRDVVNIISKKFNTKKVGHAGTLDPIATGTLVIGLGKGLKIMELLTSKTKEYKAKVILGYETDMLDITGKIIKKNIIDINEEDVKKTLKSFIGKSVQEVPIYSAVKINGKKLYEYARNGEEVILPKKEIEVYSLDLIDTPIKNEDGTTEFSISCIVSKGTYIRSLIRDIGYKLGTYGTMKELVRVKQGNFKLNDSYTLDEILNDNYKIIPISKALSSIKIIKVDDNLAFKIRNGQVLKSFFDEDMALLVDKNGVELAIYRKIDEYVKPYKMIEVQNE